MNKKVMFFLKKQVNLIMVIKIFLTIFLFFLMHGQSLSNIIYEKNNIVVTEFDIQIYQKLYKESYNADIDKSNSLKDVVLINNLIKNLEINNPEFLNVIDNEILLRLGQESFENDGIKNFFRFARIRDEFLIDYFQNKLNLPELIKLFSGLENLTLPLSIDNCLIIKEVFDLKDNEEFIKNFYNNLKNNTKDFQVTLNNVKYRVCMDDLKFQSLEKLIVDYIQIQTAEDFEKFVYEKTRN